MDRAMDIMEIKPSVTEHGKDFMKLLSTQQSVIATVLSTTSKVDKGLLAEGQDDGMEKVLAAMEDAKKRAELLS
jgi:hypothetical protein